MEDKEKQQKEYNEFLMNNLNREQRRKIMNKVLLDNNKVVNIRKIKKTRVIKEEYQSEIDELYNSAKEYIKTYLSGVKQIVIKDENDVETIITGRDLRNTYKLMVNIVDRVDTLTGRKKRSKFNGGKSKNKNINQKVNEELGEENGK